jgi:hypothetical protein
MELVKKQGFVGKYAYALRAVDGMPGLGTEADAYNFCAVGAINAITKSSHSIERVGAGRTLCDAAKRKYNQSIFDVNDYIGIEGVLKCFEEAIKSVSV